jgi:hypothetical protein
MPVSKTSRSPLGPTNRGYGAYLGRGVKLTTHFRLMPRLRMSEAVSLLPPSPPTCMACIGQTLVLRFAGGCKNPGHQVAVPAKFCTAKP